MNRGISLALIAVCQIAAMALWFSASAVVPALRAEIGLDRVTASLFTSAVQAGFVGGTLVSAGLGLADRIDPRRFFMASALVAAAANAAILTVDPASPAVIALRFATGMCMAGIYPVGMKLATTWARGDMGLLVGLLVGALTLGSAAPHLFNALGGIDWRFTLAAASGSAVAAVKRQVDHRDTETQRGRGPYGDLCVTGLRGAGMPSFDHRIQPSLRAERSNPAIWRVWIASLLRASQ